MGYWADSGDVVRTGEHDRGGTTTDSESVQSTNDSWKRVHTLAQRIFGYTWQLSPQANAADNE